MKLSRRRKFVRHNRHTKRTGKKLRYKSKKFRALKRYHRLGGRHTKKLYGRRVKNIGLYYHNLKGLKIHPSLRFKKEKVK